MSEQLTFGFYKQLQCQPMDLAYIAGLFDGEGSICIAKAKPRGGRKSPHYTLAINITNTNMEVLEWTQSLFGGSINRKEGVNKPCFSWYCSALKAEHFLMSILPFLKIKKGRAKIALGYRRWVDSLVLPSGRGRRWSNDVIAKKEEFRQRIKVLNH